MRDSLLTLLCVAALGAPANRALAHGTTPAAHASAATTKTAAPPAAPATPVARDSAPPDPVSDEERAHADAVVDSVRKELLALVDEDVRNAERGAENEPPAAAIQLDQTAPSMTSVVPSAGAAHEPTTAAASSKDLSWLEGLKLPDIPVRWDDRLVRMLEYYRSDARGRSHMRALQARRGRYGEMLRAKLRDAKLPQDLAYVAMVESGFEPAARSEVGAVGLWQFMTAPANEYGLETSRWVDQRMDPERATDAATRYFHDLYENVGSWPLAMAAFNMGYGGLLRSIQKYNSNDYWLLSSLESGLPYETVLYVTKITACAIIGQNLERFGLGDLAFDPAVRTERVEVPGGIALARVAHVLGIEPDALAALNPELKKSRTPPDLKTWTLRVPADRALHFKEKWVHYQPAAPAHRRHVLRMGERVSEVAEMYGTTSAKLLALNDQPDASNVRPGMKLLVPDVEPGEIERPEHPTVGVPGDLFVYSDRKRVFYRVADGDTLDELSRFFSVNADEIRMWNQITPDAKLQRGMYLQLFVPTEQDLSQAIVLSPDAVRTLVVGSEEFFDFHETQQNRVRIRYRVKAGDTLRSIAEHFDLSVGSLARINQFSRDKKLEPDTEIIVYVPEETGTKKRLAAN